MLTFKALLAIPGADTDTGFGTPIYNTFILSGDTTADGLATWEVCGPVVYVFVVPYVCLTGKLPTRVCMPSPVPVTVYLPFPSVVGNLLPKTLISGFDFESEAVKN